MNELLSVFFNNGVYIISLLVIFTAIVGFVVTYAEKCKNPAECSNCSDTTCSGIAYRSFKMGYKQNEPELTELQPGHVLSFSSEKKGRQEERETAPPILKSESFFDRKG